MASIVMLGGLDAAGAELASLKFPVHDEGTHAWCMVAAASGGFVARVGQSSEGQTYMLAQ